jgi:hypothetical protein
VGPTEPGRPVHGDTTAPGSPLAAQGGNPGAASAAGRPPDGGDSVPPNWEIIWIDLGGEG